MPHTSMDPTKGTRASSEVCLLQVRHLAKSYPLRNASFLQVLDDISFEVAQGEVAAVMGPTAVGKTTLLRILAGLDAEYDGEVILDGHKVSGPGGGKAMVFQENACFPWLTVIQNVMFAIEESRNFSPSDARVEAIEYLKLVGLNDRSEAYPKELSGGMKKRLEIAQALATQPKLLLGDEPFASNDTLTKQRLQEVLVGLKQTLDLTIVMATHDPQEAILLADRIYVLASKPAKIADVVRIDFGWPRSRSLRTSEEFRALENRIETLLATNTEEHT